MRKLLITLAIVIFIVCAGVWLAGTTLSWPARAAIGSPPSDLSGRSIEFASESGATIRGWFIPGTKGAGAIVLMHGVRSNRLSMLDRARFLSRAGYSVLLFDFQAHGSSTGDHITFGYLESKDAQAAIKFLRANAPGEKIGVIGVSMGGAATLLADPPLEVDAMVLEMIYPSIREAISNRLSMRLGGWSRALTPLLAWQLKFRLGVDAEALRPIDHVSKLATPKLFIVGAEDQHTTLKESQQMYSAALEPKEMWIVEGARHVDLYQVRSREYEQRVLGFFGPRLHTQAGR
jgi:fermentation-respiration switch protein FrsA (DUF1100 family)